MDPGWSENASPLYNVYEPLLGYRGAGHGDGDLEGVLATAVPSKENGLISAGGIVYRFPIREGVRFHDGTVMTPEDVRYSILRFMLTDRPGGASAALLKPILGVDSTREGGKRIEGLIDRALRAVRVRGGDVEIRLDRPFAPFPHVLANFGRVLSKDWAIAQGQWDGRAETWFRHNNLSRANSIPNDRGNGTGPFKIERFDAAARQLSLARHEGYWRGPAALKRVVIRSIPEWGTRKLMLEAGDLDVIAALPSQAPLLQGSKGVSVTGGLRKLQSATALAFNQKLEPMSDKDVRLGFAHAIDYDAFVRDVLKGEGQRNGALMPNGSWTPKYDFDLKKAEEAFRRARAGQLWENGFHASLVHLAGRDDHEILARMIQKNVEALNPKFKVSLKPVSMGGLYEIRALGTAHLMFTSWTADYADPHDFAFPLMHSKGVTAQSFGFAYPEADAAIELAATTPEPEKRAALYKKVEAIMDAELPFAPIAANTHFRVQRSNVRGYVFRPYAHGEPYDSFFYELSKGE